MTWLGQAGSMNFSKNKIQKKSAPLCGEMRKQNENGFWAAPALVGLVWQAKLEISMLPKHQFLQYKTKLYFLNTHFYNEFYTSPLKPKDLGCARLGVKISGFSLSVRVASKSHPGSAGLAAAFSHIVSSRKFRKLGAPRIPAGG